jgi:hypothetical protein
MKVIMKNLSGHAVRQLMPIFLEQIQNDNWRTKLAAVEALGSMAYCAPKQLAIYLPQIVKIVRNVLSDTHPKVHDAGIQALKDIGSVIKNPEVAELSIQLINALSDPGQYLNQALNILLETQFVHVIDAPSLSLLIPIADYGLMAHNNESKKKASCLVGHICSLTSDPSDLLPYMDIIKPAIMNSLFDSLPDVRQTSAKALGALS